MKQRTSKNFFLPLLLLSLTLACNELQPSPAKAFSHAKRHSSQKHALIGRVDLLGLPAMTEYVHPLNLFSYEAPVNWKVNNTEFGVVVYSPATVVLSVSMIHTGYKLSTSSFLRLASNTENTHYANKDQYEITSQREDKQNRVTFVEKTYLQNHIKKTAISLYRQVGSSVYIVEMIGDWVQITASPKYEALFSSFNESIRGQQNPNLEIPAYVNSWKFVESDDNDYSIDVPLGWLSVIDRSEPNQTHVQFNSPDGNATIESFLFDAGKIVDVGFAADYALKLIDKSYTKGSDDIRITSEVNLDEWKSERITWLSRSGGYIGETYFEVRNQTQVFVLTHASNRLFGDIYLPVLNTAVSTYQTFSAFK